MGRGNAIGALWVALLVVAGTWSGCRTEQTVPSADSLTNWLVTCERDEECGEASCLCGICTDSCEEDRDCTRDGTSGVCAPIDSAGVEEMCRQVNDSLNQGAGGSGSICVADCGETECPSDDLVCEDGLCLSSSDPTMGDGGSTSEPEPPRPEAGAVVALALGGDHVCALTDVGDVRCFGDNEYGQLGVGDTNHRGDEPGEMSSVQPVPLPDNVALTQVAGGVDHTCALEGAEGRVWCWGSNASGVLGTGDTENWGDDPQDLQDGLAPIDLGDGVRATSVIAGTDFACATIEGGTVKCWGENTVGQLGLGDNVNRGDQPGQMGDALPELDLGTGRSIQSLHAQSRAVCALLDDDSLKCWGSNLLEQLGTGDNGSMAHRGDEPGEMGDNLLPIDLGGGTITAVSTGGSHTCVLMNSGDLRCFGWGGVGQLGLGDTGSLGGFPMDLGVNTPNVDLGGASVTHVVAGGTTSCVVTGSDEVVCWGQNQEGQLMTFDTTNRGVDAGSTPNLLTPIPLPAGETLEALHVGGLHNCVIYQSGNFHCWGGAPVGQTGRDSIESWGDEVGEDLESLPFIQLLGD